MHNPTLLQFFHWYYPAGGQLWPEVATRAAELAEMGMTYVWLPPAYKAASGAGSVGYDTYDLFDFGEFDQRGSLATKYGDRAGLQHAIDTLKTHKIGTLLDVVVNHKMGADEKEAIQVNRVNPENREDIQDDVVDCEAWTRFTFPARQGKYSQFIWDFRCFNGVDHIENPDEDGIFKIVNDYRGEGWNDQVDDELGNFDYLMGANIDFRNHAVTEELKYWARWVVDQFGCAGFRLDAVKHIPAWYYKEWIDHIQQETDAPLLMIAEYWSHDVEKLQQYIHQVEGKTLLFDAPLQLHFHHASRDGAAYDLREIFTDTLVASDPWHAVTLVANHDTQPLQSLEAPIEDWFKPLAYALILLRDAGVPSIFYPDLYGAKYSDTGSDGQQYDIDMPVIASLPRLIQARQRFAWGEQRDWFDHANCVAFQRCGDEQHAGCVVIMSNGDAGEKNLALGEPFANWHWQDWLGHCPETVVSDDTGNTLFQCPAGGVSVWVASEAI